MQIGQLPRHSVSVTGIVLRDDGRVLAIKRHDDGRWFPPGCGLELDEPPKTALPARSTRKPA